MVRLHQNRAGVAGGQAGSRKLNSLEPHSPKACFAVGFIGLRVKAHLRILQTVGSIVATLRVQPLSFLFATPLFPVVGLLRTVFDPGPCALRQEADDIQELSAEGRFLRLQASQFVLC